MQCLVHFQTFLWGSDTRKAKYPKSSRGEQNIQKVQLLEGNFESGCILGSQKGIHQKILTFPSGLLVRRRQTPEIHESRREYWIVILKVHNSEVFGKSKTTTRTNSITCMYTQEIELKMKRNTWKYRATWKNRWKVGWTWWAGKFDNHNGTIAAHTTLQLCRDYSSRLLPP